jgi:predicted transcriptional regulator
MAELKLCESDFRFMGVLWDNEPVASGDLVALCRERLGWKKSTTYTVLKKMSDRGFAQNLDSTVTSLVPRDRVEAFASERFVEQTFDGSLPRFLVSFLEGKSIPEQQAKELKRLIDARKEG